MPIVTQCLEPGCKTMTIGPFCLDHEPAAAPGSFPRGRPVASASLALGEDVGTVTADELEGSPLAVA